MPVAREAERKCVLVKKENLEKMLAKERTKKENTSFQDKIKKDSIENEYSVDDNGFISLVGVRLKIFDK